MREYDLAHTITWDTTNTCTQPQTIPTALRIIDHYNLRLRDDVPLVLALRAWPDRAIKNYYSRNCLTFPAHEQLVDLLRNAERAVIRTNVVAFLNDTNHTTQELQTELTKIALDASMATQARLTAIQILTKHIPAKEALQKLRNDSEPQLSSHALIALAKQGDIATIMEALAVQTTDDQLKAGEVEFPLRVPRIDCLH